MGSKVFDKKPILYSYWRSSCAFRVRIGLELKDIPFEFGRIDLGKNSDQLSDDYKEINPMMQVPSFVYEKDGKKHTLIQSVAILELLDELAPQPSLLPKNPIDRAYVRSIVECIASGIQPLQNLESLRLVEQSEARFNEFANLVITKKFHSLEQLLKKFAGKYSYGDTLTMADLFVVPQVYNANRYNVDMSLFPTIYKVNEELKNIPAFQKAWPENQPDAPQK